MSDLETMQNDMRQCRAELYRLRAILRAIVYAWERGQRAGYADAMDAAREALGK